MVIEVEGLSKSYGAHLVVDDVGFTVTEGEIFGILGVIKCRWVGGPGELSPGTCRRVLGSWNGSALAATIGRSTAISRSLDRPSSERPSHASPVASATPRSITGPSDGSGEAGHRPSLAMAQPATRCTRRCTPGR